jgi:hypothetical protein
MTSSKGAINGQDVIGKEQEAKYRRDKEQGARCASEASKRSKGKEGRWHQNSRAYNISFQHIQDRYQNI